MRIAGRNCFTAAICKQAINAWHNWNLKKIVNVNEKMQNCNSNIWCNYRKLTLVIAFNRESVKPVFLLLSRNRIEERSFVQQTDFQNGGLSTRPASCLFDRKLKSVILGQLVDVYIHVWVLFSFLLTSDTPPPPSPKYNVPKCIHTMLIFTFICLSLK